MKTKIRHITLLIMLLLGGMSAYAASVRLTVDAGRGRRQAAVGEPFYIYYEVSDLDAVPEKPASVPGAKVMYFDRTGQSSTLHERQRKDHPKLQLHLHPHAACAEGGILYLRMPFTVGESRVMPYPTR